MDLIIADYNEKLNKANSKHLAKKKEYDDRKANIDNDIHVLKQEYDEKISQLQAQKNSFMESIESLKKDIADKQAEHDNQVKEIENERISTLDEMARKQNEALAKITNDYEDIPNKELSIVREEFDAKQKEYNDNAREVALKKQSIDNEYNAFVDAKNIEKEKIDNELAEATKEFEKTKTELDKQEQIIADELAKRKQELQNFKDELAQEIEKTKEERKKQEEETVQKIDQEYAALEKQLEEKRLAISRQYDEELKVYQDDLTIKNESLQSLINGINQRRKDAETQYIAKYDETAELTKKMQKEYEDLINANNIKNSNGCIEL